MKKIMALVLSVAMVLCAVPSFAFAAGTETTPPTGTEVAVDLTKGKTTVSGISEKPYVFTGKEIKITDLAVKYTAPEENAQEVILIEGTDYELEYKNNMNATAGEKLASVVIKGINKYSGTITKDFAIDSVDPTATGILNITIPTQNLNEEMENVEITWNGIELDPLKDFSVEGNNKQLGTQTATIKFKGNYKGEKKHVQYNVVSNDIKDAAFYWSELNKTYTYDGAAKEPGVRLNLNGKNLVKDVDYTVSYADNIDAGTNAKVIVTGIGEYAGVRTETFTINKANLADTDIIWIKDTYTATGTEIRPEAGKDFKLSFKGTELTTKEYCVETYAGNIAIGKATMTLGIPAGLKGGNFTGTKSVQFEIVDKAVSDLEVTLEKKEYSYTGEKVEPVVTVKDGDKVLVKDTDYTVTYGENIRAGIGTIVITGKSAGYTGTKTVEFKINGKQAGLITGSNTYTRYWPKPASLNLRARSEADEEGFIYTANNPEIATVDPSGNVTIHNTGKATITVETYGTKEYNPIKKTVTINVKPGKPVLTLSSTSKKVIKATFTKQKGATKYQIRYGRAGKYYYKYAKHIDSKYTKTYTYLKNRTSGKTYYIKVRAYKEMADGTRVYGDWSATKKIKAK